MGSGRTLHLFLRQMTVSACECTLKEGQAPRFIDMAAMYSELVAINSAGHLCQWRWADPEPFTTTDVCGYLLTVRSLTHSLSFFLLSFLPGGFLAQR